MKRQKQKNTFQKFFISLNVTLAITLGMFGLIPWAQVNAQTVEITCSDGTVLHVGASLALNGDACGSHGGTAVNNSTGSGGGSNSGDCSDTGELTKENCGIINYIVTFTRALTGAAGVIVAIMIVWGGIKYTISKDNPQETAAAKQTIRNALIALVFYFFTFALLQWLVPGGIL